MIKPMLAYKVDKKPVDWSEKVFMQPKLDGVRCVISKDGAWSRTGKPWLNIDHILENLKPFFKQHPDIILDGELYNHELKNDFEKIISLVRKTKPEAGDRVESAAYVQFHCYDYVDTKALFEERMNNLATSDMYSYCVKYVPTQQVKTREIANAIHNNWLESGYEGSIDA